MKIFKKFGPNEKIPVVVNLLVYLCIYFGFRTGFRQIFRRTPAQIRGFAFRHVHPFQHAYFRK